jgi:hypothetical protein
LSAGRHAVQMQSVRAGQRLTTSNLFLHNVSTGQTEMWLMRGGSRVDYRDFESYLNLPDSTGWRFVGTRDFDHDGNPDVLIHNVSSGAFQVWYMNHGVRNGYADFDSYLNLPDSTGWRVVGLADINHDGMVDVIIHNGTSGGTQVWYMNGVTRITWADLDPSLNVGDGSGWRPAGTGDFDQDGNTDLLWHNGVNGETQVWYMNGTTRVAFANLDPFLNLSDDTGWTIIDTGDASFDGRPDLLWHNRNSGALQVWYMSNTTRVELADFDPYLNLPDSTGWLFINPS